jgi:hypothetical protein
MSTGGQPGSTFERRHRADTGSGKLIRLVYLLKRHGLFEVRNEDAADSRI